MIFSHLYPHHLHHCLELLYPYTATPPSGYGAVTPYVVDTVARSLDYNSYKGSLNLTENFAVDPTKTTSLIDYDFLQKTSRTFYNEFQGYIMEGISKTLEVIPHIKMSVLSKGNQTYSPLQDRCVPAPMALAEIVDLVKWNLNTHTPNSLIGLCNKISLLMELDEISIKKNVTVHYKKYSTIKRKLITNTRIAKKSINWTNKEFLVKMCTLSTSIKHKERGKLKRRSIASPGMLIRGFIKIFEDLCANICRKLPCAGIPIGGEEKRSRIVAINQTVPSSDFSVEVTGDNTKWNECIQTGAICEVVEIFLSLYEKVNPETDLTILRDSILFVNWVFENKIALLGRGISVINKYGHRKYMNPKEFKCTCDLGKKVDQIRELISIDGKNVECPTGMFMGMLNQGSTLLGLVASFESRIAKTKQMQSSDDFITVVHGKNRKLVQEQLSINYYNNKRLGINNSPEKTYFISPSGTSEFTSDYKIDREFIFNIGPELPGLFPQGINPMVDLQCQIRNIHEAASKQKISYLAVLNCILFSVEKFRQTYHCYPEDTWGRSKMLFDLLKENNMSKEELMIYHGGRNIYNVSTLFADEISLRRERNLWPEQYYKNISTSDNPFALTGKEVIKIDMEGRKPGIEASLQYSNCLAYKFKRNRSCLNNSEGLVSLDKEKNMKELVELCKLIIPDICLDNTVTGDTIGQSLINRLYINLENVVDPMTRENLSKILAAFWQKFEASKLLEYDS